MLADYQTRKSASRSLDKILLFVLAPSTTVTDYTNKTNKLAPAEFGQFINVGIFW